MEANLLTIFAKRSQGTSVFTDVLAGEQDDPNRQQRQQIYSSTLRPRRNLFTFQKLVPLREHQNPAAPQECQYTYNIKKVSFLVCLGSGRFLQGTHSTGGWEDPRASLKALARRNPLPNAENRNQVAHPYSPASVTELSRLTTDIYVLEFYLYTHIQKIRRL
jgi:hypothetical protein